MSQKAVAGPGLLSHSRTPRRSNGLVRASSHYHRIARMENGAAPESSLPHAMARFLPALCHIGRPESHQSWPWP
jgi:hypothetical protein